MDTFRTMFSPAPRVMLVGYQEQDNLGVRYLASSLIRAGAYVRIESFGVNPEPLVRAALHWKPDIVGFSMIFQFRAPDFGNVMSALRQAGIGAHFTMGGHYASFAPETLLQLIPELDSVVSFEGEQTLVELTEALKVGGGWREVRGIAWRDALGVHVTSPRRDGPPLDSLPWPDRSDIAYHAQELPTASVLGSRGGPGRRLRDPMKIVSEMEHLVRDRHVKLIVFQDGDFLAGGKDAREWAKSIARETKQRCLDEHMRFKVSCRSDEVNEEVFWPLVEAGLTHVCLGAGSGDQTRFRAGEVMRRLNLSFDFEFMLLDPWSTIASVKTNLSFLREFCAGGYTAARFCRASPLAGTPMERRLRNEGRLIGPALDADYQFLDPRLNALWDYSLAASSDRNYGKDATWDLLGGLLFEAHLDYPDRPYDKKFLRAAQSLTGASNTSLLDSIGEALEYIVQADLHTAGDPRLIEMAKVARQQDSLIRGSFAASWATRPRAAAQELFR